MVSGLTVSFLELSLLDNDILTLTLMCIRTDPKFAGSLCRGAFKLGGNSSCRQHIRSHYPRYLKRCEEEGIEPKEHCMPREMLEKLQLAEAIAAGKAKKGVMQGTLDAVVTRRDIPSSFTDKLAVTLHAVAQYVVCKDIVSTLLDNRMTLINHLRSLSTMPMTSLSGTLFCR